MSNLKNKNVEVIVQNPGLPEFLDFAFLRRKGLEHIAKYSGKIWTDHNTHDPGITMLEALCYALLDLGYRTQLPLEDLFAPKELLKPGEPDDNFLTPAEILTCNPVTITDYRKLLMEVEGVRNAWLEPVEESEPTLYFDSDNCQLNCIQGTFPLHLNGLYNVYIEISNPDQLIIDPNGNCSADIQTNEFVKKLINEVQDCLSRHRNLGEDFVKIILLCPRSVEICVDIELTDGYEADKVYLQVIRQLQEYLSPTARFYTLQTLLEKGKNIEDIYAGRPYQLAHLVEPCTKDGKTKEGREDCDNPCSNETRLLNLLQNSHGFIDTEELEKVERRTEIRLSDLYSVLHDIEGVESVKNLCLVNLPAASSSAWVYPIPEGCIPVLEESSIINLYNKGVKLPYDAKKIREQLTQYNKTRLENGFLNLEIPYGAAREGLNEYWSVQTELPRVYGIGETGLPDSATLLRKTQAHQLRAFLLFFDQLLANYLQQLSHIRDIYSRAPEKTRKPELKHSFFAKKLENKSTQELNTLLRFGANPDRPITEGSVIMAAVNNPALQTILCDIRDTMNDTLLVELACEKSPAPENRIRRLKARGFKSMARRNRVMESARRDFSNGNYDMQVIQDFSGFFFVFCLDSMPELAFVSYEHYNSRSEAHNAANSAAYWASLTDNYRTYRTGSDFDFEIVFRTADYANFIQNLLENPDAYTHRRNNLLNHLMARFAERFSDYAAIAFGAALQLPQTASNHCEAAPQVPDLETIIQHKSDFLWNYPDLSRNRGRAFDYRCPSWNTDNISGFEKRVFALAGITNRQRRNLCNIEVLPKPSLKEVGFIAGTNEKVFYSEKPVLSGYAAEKMAAALQEGMKRTDTIKHEKDPKTGLYNYFLEYKGYRFKGEGLYSSLSAVEDKIRDIKNLYIGEFDPTRNLFPTEFKFEQILTGTDLKFPNPELFNDQETAISKEAVKSLLDKATREFEKSRPEIDLHLADDRKNILQLGAWTKTASHYQEIPGQWVWSIWPADKQSELQHDSLEKATADSIEYLKTKGYLQAVSEAYFWQLSVKNSITWQGAQLFKEKERAQTAWRQAKEWGVKKNAYHLVQSKTQGARIELRNAKSVVLANTNWFNSNKFDAQELVGDMMERFGNSNTKLKFEKLDSAWSFWMFSSSGKPALESYEVYPTETAALSDLQKAYKSAGNAKAYLPSGDAVNLHYIFILKGDDQRFLAQNQPEFSSSNARDKALKQHLSDFKGAIQFLQYKQLQPTYRVNARPTGKQVSISSLKNFPSLEQARNALVDTMIAIFEAKRVKESEWKLHIAGGAEKDAVQLLKKELEAATMKVETSSKAVKWRFQNNRAKADGGLEPLWRSEKEFDDEKKLTEEYTAFFNSIKNLPVVSTTNKPVHLAKGNQKIATLAAVSRPSAGEITSIKKTMELIASIDKPLSAIIGNWVRPVDVLQPAEVDRAIISNKQYIYQFAKKDQPVACHPCPVGPCKDRNKTLAKGKVKTYNKPQDACEIKELLFNKNFLFNQFPDFCQSLQKTIQLPTGENGLCKHHFVLYDLRENKNLWVSFSGYDTKELALEALEEQFFDLLEIAACKDNYGKNGKIRTYWDFAQYVSGCNPNSECVAVVAEELINSYGANENGLIEYLSGKAAAYPVFKYLDRYYFQLSDPSAPTTPLLVSKESFGSHLEALRAFEYLLQLLAYPNNISVTATSGLQNSYRIDIIELLAVSAQTYSNQTQNDGSIISGEDLAWGRDKEDHCVRAERQAPCATDPNACHYGVEEFLFEAQKPGAIYPVKEGDYYTYYIVKECFITDFEACWYDTPEQRDQVMNNPEDWKFQSVNDSSSQSGNPLCPCGEELPDLPYTCMLELKGSFLRNWNSIQKDIFEDAKRRRDGQYKNLCNPLQEKTGLPRYRLMPVDAGECGPYSFQIVDTCCILAQSPQCFSEASMRDAAMNRFQECVRDEGMHLLEHILLRPQPGDPNCDREQDPSSKNPKCFLPICPDTDCDNLTWVKDPNSECSSDRQEITYIPFSDPYSFWVTITLPAWMGRFQRPEAKALMEYLLRKEAPAHIALNIKWLSPRQLCGFENKLHQWLNTKACPDLTWSRSHISIDCSAGLPPDESNITNSAACQLAMCLQDLVRYVPCCEREGQLPQPCACAPRETSKPCPPFELFDKSCCKPEPKKEEPSQPGRSLTDLSTPEKGRAWFNTRLEARSSDTLTEAQVKSLIKTEAGQEAKGRILDNFLRSEGLFAQFKQHIQHLLDTGGNKFSASYKQLAKAAIHHLLDKGLEKTGTNGKPAFEPEAFITTIKPLNEKGLNINVIANEWPNENLEKVFGKPAVDLYAEMLKKA